MATTYTLGQVAIVNKGAYSSSAAYKQLNTVSHRGGTFMCIVNCSNIEPGVNANWRNYWVQTAVGIYTAEVTATGANVTITYTMSDGTTFPVTYPATAIAAGTITNAMLGEYVSVENGGTGASTADGALTNLGIPTPFSVSNGGTGANNAETARSNLGAQAQAVSYQVSITGDGTATTWTVTKDVNNNNITDVKAGSNLIVAGDPSTRANYNGYGVALTAQANGSLTFTADFAIPSGTTVLINVLIFN